MRVLFCGDIMPGGVLPYQNSYISQDLLQFMQGFDFRIGTLECAIGSGFPYDRNKMEGSKNIVYAREEDFFRLCEMNINVVSLANNHIYDLGEDGLRNTIRMLEDNNLFYVGAGMDIEQASRPAVISIQGKTIALLAACMYGNKYLGYIELAGKNKSGVNPLDIDVICKDIISAKRKYDYVFVLPHWGKEHILFPMNECVSMAKSMIEAGADGVFGSHAHVPQPRIIYKGKPICFGMGNFLFPDFYLYPPRPVWYPNDDYDLSSIKIRNGYPDYVMEPSRATWGKMERIGEMVLCNIGGRIKTSLRLVQLNNNNILAFCSSSKTILSKLSFIGLMVKYPLIKRLLSSVRTILRPHLG